MADVLEGLYSIGESVAKTTEDVQSSLGFFKEFVQTISIGLDDVGIILLYGLYIAMPIIIIRLLFMGWTSYQKNKNILSKILFIKQRPVISKKRKRRTPKAPLSRLRPS